MGSWKLKDGESNDTTNVINVMKRNFSLFKNNFGRYLRGPSDAHGLFLEDLLIQCHIPSIMFKGFMIRNYSTRIS